jgi:hypothetical protein
VSIRTGKFVSEAEYAELIELYKNPSIELRPGGITIATSGPARARARLNQLAIEKGLPKLEVTTDSYGMDGPTFEIMAPEIK